MNFIKSAFNLVKSGAQAFGKKLAAVAGVGIAAAATSAQAVDSAIVTDVSTKLTQMATDSTTLGILFLGIVAILAVIGLAKRFLGHK